MTAKSVRRLVRQKRKVSYSWRLREVMAEHKMYATTELVPLLAERGIILSASQVHRLVTATPERLSLQVLAAFCDIFGVDAAELIGTEATNLGVAGVVGGNAGSTPARQKNPGTLHPVHARRRAEGVSRKARKDSESERDASTAAIECARCHRPLRLIGHARPARDDPRGHVLVASRNWPEGRICSGCYAKACEVYGTCAVCNVHRLLPGIGEDGERLCTDCAGGLGDFTCTRCQKEGWKHYRGICGRCVLSDRLSVELDDGTGRVRPELVAFFEQIAQMARPRAGILWLSKAHVSPILRSLATGAVPLTHDGLSSLSPPKSVAHIRDLLVAAGVLAPVDRQLVQFERWLPGWLEQLSDPAPAKLLQTYATWSVLRQLREIANQHSISPYREQAARHELRSAAAFLEHLASRGVELAGCAQADLDRWLATASDSAKNTLWPFFNWAMRTRRMSRLSLPPLRQQSAKPISSQERVALLRRIYVGDGMDLIERVIAMFILLYAQPLSRITQLSVDDVTVEEDGMMLIRLGDPPVPVPTPFAAIIKDYLTTRAQRSSATNPDSAWLFPGRSAGQPLHPTSIRTRLRRHGIPNLPGRSRALRELVAQAPPSVVAGMLGYSVEKTAALAANAGTTYHHYATGEHTRTRSPRL